MTQKVQLQHLNLIPGKKLCVKCRIKVIELENKEESSEQSQISDSEVILENSMNVETSMTTVSERLSLVGVSPLKLHGLPSSSRVATGKRKLSVAVNNLQQKIAKSIDVPSDILTNDKTN